jgi:hypothetical protein
MKITYTYSAAYHFRAMPHLYARYLCSKSGIFLYAEN